MTSLATPLDSLELLRTVLALIAFLFLPGWLFASTWFAEKNKTLALAELVALSVFASVVFLSLIVSALAFTIGANFFTVLGCELLLIGGLWFWKKKKSA
ncbi:MAG: LPXTG cell wall anchor domain-containing protein [Candidatus Norongarragalinales archaeon]